MLHVTVISAGPYGLLVAAGLLKRPEVSERRLP